VGHESRQGWSPLSHPGPSASIEALCEFALRSTPLTHVPIRRDRVSNVRVFGKSLHLLAAGWVTAVAILWIVGLRQVLQKHGVLVADLGLSLLALRLASGLVIEMIAIYIGRLSSAPLRTLQREEWRHAVCWAAFPHALVAVSVYITLTPGA
jgi:hypothetical protein